MAAMPGEYSFIAQMRCIENTRVTVSIERFANAGLNGHFEHSHLVVSNRSL